MIVSCKPVWRASSRAVMPRGPSSKSRRSGVSLTPRLRRTASMSTSLLWLRLSATSALGRYVRPTNETARSLAQVGASCARAGFSNQVPLAADALHEHRQARDHSHDLRAALRFDTEPSARSRDCPKAVALRVLGTRSVVAGQLESNERLAIDIDARRELDPAFVADIPSRRQSH